LAIAGGGTGGHIFPALAIAAQLKKTMPEIELLYLGMKGGLEEKLASTAELPFHPIPARPLRRSLSPANLLIPFTLWKGKRTAAGILNRHGVDALLGTGGYVSVPALYGARRRGAKIFLQEQNSYPGLATRLFARHAQVVFLAYSRAQKFLPSIARVMSVGNPLRQNFALASRAEGLNFFGLDCARKTLLIFGGAQGAEALNRKVRDSLPRLRQLGHLQIIWQAGRANFAHYQQIFQTSGVAGRILEFIDRMELALAAADLAFCRAGALSLSELAVCGLPAVLVPYPHAAEDHQYHNARAFEERGAAVVIRQSELDRFDLPEFVEQLFADEQRLKKMSEAAKTLGDAQASQKIADKIIAEMGW